MSEKQEIELLKARLELAQATNRTYEALFDVLYARLRALAGAAAPLPVGKKT